MMNGITNFNIQHSLFLVRYSKDVELIKNINSNS